MKKLGIDGTAGERIANRDGCFFPSAQLAACLGVDQARLGGLPHSKFVAGKAC